MGPRNVAQIFTASVVTQSFPCCFEFTTFGIMGVLKMYLCKMAVVSVAWIDLKACSALDLEQNTSVCSTY